MSNNHKPGWFKIVIMSGILTATGLLFAVPTAYNIWRNYQSIGIYKLVTTGEVTMKEVSEKTGRRSYKKVNRYYAKFRSADKKYEKDDQITPLQASAIKKRGTRYARTYEIFVDRNGNYRVSKLNKEKSPQDNRWPTLLFFSLLSGVGIITCSYSFKKWRA